MMGMGNKRNWGRILGADKSDYTYLLSTATGTKPTKEWGMVGRWSQGKLGWMELVYYPLPFLPISNPVDASALVIHVQMYNYILSQVHN